MELQNYKHKTFPKFKPAGCENCKGHGNLMLDVDYSDVKDRQLMIQIMTQRIGDEKGHAIQRTSK